MAQSQKSTSNMMIVSKKSKNSIQEKKIQKFKSTCIRKFLLKPSNSFDVRRQNNLSNHALTKIIENNVRSQSNDTNAMLNPSGCYPVGSNLNRQEQNPHYKFSSLRLKNLNPNHYSDMTETTEPLGRFVSSSEYEGRFSNSTDKSSTIFNSSFSRSSSLKYSKLLTPISDTRYRRSGSIYSINNNFDPKVKSKLDPPSTNILRPHEPLSVINSFDHINQDINKLNYTAKIENLSKSTTYTKIKWSSQISEKQQLTTSVFQEYKTKFKNSACSCHKSPVVYALTKLNKLGHKSSCRFNIEMLELV